MLRTIPNIFVFIGAIVTFGVIAFFLIVNAPLEDLDAAERQHERLKNEYTDAFRASANLDPLRQQLIEVRNLHKAQRTMLPDDDGAEGGQKYLENAIRAAAAKTSLESSLELSIGNSALKDFYAVRPFSVRVAGDFRNVVNFLHHISTASDQLRVLKRVSVQPRWSNKGVALSLEADAFTYLTEESLAASRKAKARNEAKKQE